LSVEVKIDPDSTGIRDENVLNMQGMEENKESKDSKYTPVDGEGNVYPNVDSKDIHNNTGRSLSALFGAYTGIRSGSAAGMGGAAGSLGVNEILNSRPPETKNSEQNQPVEQVIYRDNRTIQITNNSYNTGQKSSHHESVNEEHKDEQ
jgi:hypothetical protein